MPPPTPSACRRASAGAAGRRPVGGARPFCERPCARATCIPAPFRRHRRRVRTGCHSTRNA
eukprot:1487875-Pleurochrysis_carterae.AAC.1